MKLRPAVRVPQCFVCHTAMVRTGRVVLSLIAAFLLVSVFTWGTRSQHEDAGTENNTAAANAILEPRLYGVDKDNRPYVVRAASGTTLPPTTDNKSQTIELNNISADFKTDGTAPLSLGAAKGTYNAEQGSLLLNGDVVVNDGKGNTLNGTSAIVDVDAQTARSLDPVSATTAKQKIEAGGVVIKDGGNSVVFTGKTAVKPRTPKAEPKPAPKPKGGS